MYFIKIILTLICLQNSLFSADQKAAAENSLNMRQEESEDIKKRLNALFSLPCLSPEIFSQIRSHKALLLKKELEYTRSEGG